MSEQRTTEEIAKGILSKITTGPGETLKGELKIGALLFEIIEALDTERARAEEAEKNLEQWKIKFETSAHQRHAIEDCYAKDKAKLSEAQKGLEMAKGYIERNVELEALVVEKDKALSCAVDYVAWAKIPLPDGHWTTVYDEVRKALALTPADIRSQLEEANRSAKSLLDQFGHKSQQFIEAMQIISSQKQTIKVMREALEFVRGPYDCNGTKPGGCHIHDENTQCVASDALTLSQQVSEEKL